MLQAAACEYLIGDYPKARLAGGWALLITLLLLYNAQRTDSLEAGAFDVPYYKIAHRPQLLEATPCDVPFYYFTMHRDQPCWRLQLFNYAEYFNNNDYDYDYDYDYYYYYYHYYCYYYYCYKQSRVDAPAGQADQPRPR